MEAVNELSPVIGVQAACAVPGLPRSSFFRRQRPIFGPSKNAVSARTLSLPERKAVLTCLQEERFQDRSPAAVDATLLDEGVYHCSLSGGQQQSPRAVALLPHLVQRPCYGVGMNRIWCLLWLLVGSAMGQSKLVNPLLPSGADPWITSRNGFYYYMNTTGSSLVIWKTRSISALATAGKKTVWRPPASGPYSHDIWAPELHFLRGKWYIYFAADGGRNATHRIWVLENAAADPLDGEWRMLGKVADPSDRWAIDATVFEQDSRLYMVWSGWEAEVNGGQNLYIAELSNPNTVKGSRVRISAPAYPWEKIGDLRPQVATEANPGADPANPIHVDVNEGPEILRHGNRIFLVYSAGGCWTDYYSLGILTASVGSNLMDPASWKKSPAPVFWLSPEAHAYGTGHNSFFQSPDGKEDWILYHANSEPQQGCGNRRAPRAQPFTWKPDGMPDFGRPVSVGVPIAAPSGGN